MAFRIWNTMSMFNLSISEVGYLMEKYIAKDEASSIEGERDNGEPRGSSQGSGGPGNGEAGKKPLAIDEMKDMLAKKDQEIEQMRQLLAGWGGLDGLRKRLEKTKGQMGWERIRKLEDALKKRGEDLDRARERLGEYKSTFESLQQESLERLRAVEMAITKLDEFIAYPHPDRPEFEDREIKVLRGKFAALWETDREQWASRLLGPYYPIMSPNHKLGDGCSEYL
jgi:hypothetical protein